MATGLISRPTETKGQIVNSVSFTDDDLWASIGAKAEQHTFAQRTLALSDPAAYGTARAAAVDALKGSAATTFTATHDRYKAAGYSPAEAKRLAIAASKQVYDVGKKALNASFPSAIDSVYWAAAPSKGVMMASRSAPKKTKRKGSKRR